MSVQTMKYLFTVEEYHQMGQAGILSEDDRVELIEGEIIQMSPIGKIHALFVMRLNRLFSKLFSRYAIINVQNPIYLSEDSEPQPDLTLIQLPLEMYMKSHPKPENIFLIVEVSDTTLDYDQTVKIPLYARAGIREVWLVNLMEEILEVYRNPSPEGYTHIERYRRGQTLSLVAFPDIPILVQDILG